MKSILYAIMAMVFLASIVLVITDYLTQSFKQKNDVKMSAEEAIFTDQLKLVTGDYYACSEIIGGKTFDTAIGSVSPVDIDIYGELRQTFFFTENQLGTNLFIVDIRTRNDSDYWPAAKIIIKSDGANAVEKCQRFTPRMRLAASTCPGGQLANQIDPSGGVLCAEVESDD